MTNKEIVEMLQILLDNAKVGCADITVIRHVSFDSFKFVIGNTIKALEQEPFLNKPCVSENVCEHDKQMVLDKIRAEIMSKDGLEEALEIIDKYTEKQKECD